MRGATAAGEGKRGVVVVVVHCGVSVAAVGIRNTKY